MATSYSDADFYRRFRRYFTYIEPVLADPVIKSYFSLIASLLLIALFIVFALSPTVSTIVGLMKKLDDQRQTIASMDKKINDLITAQESLSDFDPYLTPLNNALPEIPRIETVVDSIQLAAANSSVVVNSLEFAPVNLLGNTRVVAKPILKFKTGSFDPQMRTIIFSLTATGSNPNLRSFLVALEKTPRLIRIANLSISQSGGSVTLSGYALYIGQQVEEPVASVFGSTIAKNLLN